VTQVQGNKNPRDPQIRWILGTAIKSRQRAAPYPATHEQKDAAPKVTWNLQMGSRYPTNYLRLGEASKGEKARVEAAR
jgi:hypothetical protein